VTPDDTLHATACGAFLLPHDERRVGRFVDEVEPPAAGERKRSADERGRNPWNELVIQAR